MTKYIVIGFKPDKSIEVLASPSVEFGKMKKVIHDNTRNEKFEVVQMFSLEPHTRAYHPITLLKSEAKIKADKVAAEKADAEKLKQQDDLKAKAESDEKSKAEKEAARKSEREEAEKAKAQREIDEQKIRDAASKERDKKK